MIARLSAVSGADAHREPTFNTTAQGNRSVGWIVLPVDDPDRSHPVAILLQKLQEQQFRRHAG
jgi:hypothetical protein